VSGGGAGAPGTRGLAPRKEGAGARSRPAAARRPLVACRDCDLLHRVAELPHGATARCTRCGGVLAQSRRNSVDRSLAWTAGSALLFVLANTFPILVFRMQGREQQNVLVSGCLELARQGWWPLAALVFVASVAAPALRLAALLHVLVPLRLGRTPWGFVRAFRLVDALEPWSMLEVFMLGVVVAIIKLSGMAEVLMGAGLYAFMMLIVTSTAATAVLDRDLVWRHAGGRAAVAGRMPRAAEGQAT